MGGIVLLLLMHFQLKLCKIFDPVYSFFHGQVFQILVLCHLFLVVILFLPINFDHKVGLMEHSNNQKFELLMHLPEIK